jgi:hypothetical protein
LKKSNKKGGVKNMKVNMRKFAEWILKDDPQGRIIKITPQCIVINKRAGTFEEEYWNLYKNEKYTRKEAIEIYRHLSETEKKEVDWLNMEKIKKPTE